MTRYLEVSGGIYIDYECRRIEKITKGVFIPTEYQTNMTEEKFKMELQNFLDKWFSENVFSSNQEHP